MKRKINKVTEQNALLFIV